MRSRIVTIALLAALLTGTPLVASAMSLTWTVQNAFFADGTSLTGSFDYNADTNLYSNLNLVTQADPVGFPGSSYNGAATATTIGTFGVFTTVAAPGTPGYTLERLNIFFLDALTNLGGTVSIAGFDEFVVPDGFSGGTRIDNFNVRGSVSASSVPTPLPEPGTLGLMLIGLAGATLVRKRKQR